MRRPPRSSRTDFAKSSSSRTRALCSRRCSRIPLATKSTFSRRRYCRLAQRAASASVARQEDASGSGQEVRKATFANGLHAESLPNAAHAELFSHLLDARTKLEAWRRDYNEHRPHSSIGNLTP